MLHDTVSQDALLRNKKYKFPQYLDKRLLNPQKVYDSELFFFM